MNDLFACVSLEITFANIPLVRQTGIVSGIVVNAPSCTMPLPSVMTVNFFSVV